MDSFSKVIGDAMKTDSELFDMAKWGEELMCLLDRKIELEKREEKPQAIYGSVQEVYEELYDWGMDDISWDDLKLPGDFPQSNMWNCVEQNDDEDEWYVA